MFTFDLKKLGEKCAEFRRSKGYTQLQVAYRLGYTESNISAFENGRTNNLCIFFWYLSEGMQIDWKEVVTREEVGKVNGYRN